MEVEIPVDLTVEYRYLVVRRVVSGDKEVVCVDHWETTIHPRQICLRKMKAGNSKTDGGEEEGEPLTRGRKEGRKPLCYW